MQIGARTLPCRITAHGETGQNRKQRCKNSTGQCSQTGLQGDIVARDIWTRSTGPCARHDPIIPAIMLTKALSRTNSLTTLRRFGPQSHAQRNLAAPTGETNQQQICDIGAGDEQDRARSYKQGNESRSQIAGGIFRCRHQNRGPDQSAVSGCCSR